MVKLCIDKRRELLSYVVGGKFDNQYFMADRECAYYSGDMDAREVLMRKYRMITCIIIMKNFGYVDVIEELKLLNAEELFTYCYSLDEDAEYDECWQEQLVAYLSELVDFGTQYLSGSLRETGWNVHYITDLNEYENLSPEVIEKCRDAINMHWSALNEYYGEKLESKYLSALGCAPDSCYTFFADCNVILTNDNIRKMVKICEIEQQYREWPEYNEMKKVKQFILFDRYFPDVSNINLDDKDWVCVSYLLGEVETDKLEEVGFYQLTYEAVFNLLVADQIAYDFLKRYYKEQEDCETIVKRKVS